MGSKKIVKIKDLSIGGNNPVRVESMLKLPLSDPEKCIEEINLLNEIGCELIRVALPNLSYTDNLSAIIKTSRIPLMADIHFDYKLALVALDMGIPSIRINPGNISNTSGVQEIVSLAKETGSTIRIGANSGSINNKQIAEAKGDKVLSLVNAVEEQIHILENEKFDNIIISAKSSSILETIRANQLLSQKYRYPIHIGITEAGLGTSGIVKGAVGIGSMLLNGIGDTIRVSLTERSSEEIKVAYEILKSLNIRKRGYNLISCPTCGRKRTDVMKLAKIVTSTIPENTCEGMTIAVMGCEVNGPREASEADFGVAGAPDGIILFEKGKYIKTIDFDSFPSELKKLLNIKS
ncbi:MAG: flavodoxin-dependent (E)-4-hydroxy-3-methylbut-2-enyl-diphosphate synthase [Synergistaceae bacterium]